MHLLAVIAAFGTLGWAPIKTREVRVTRADVAEVAIVLRTLTSERGQVVVNARRQTVRVTDLAWEVDLMLRVVRAIERMNDDQKVWITSVRWTAASDLATKLNEVFAAVPRHLRKNFSTIIPDDRKNRLIIIANERTYARIHRMICCPDIPLDREYDRVDDGGYGGQENPYGPIELP